MEKKKIIVNMTWKMLVKRLLFVFLPISILALVGVNYFLDGENLYFNQYERIMARQILSGHNITNISKYNDRFFQKHVITKMKNCPEIAIFGSTRTMMINNFYFGNFTFFNHSLNGATIEDIITLIMLYDIKKCLPKKIVIGIDPWLLNEKNKQERWKYLAKEYNIALQKLGLESIVVDTGYIQKLPDKLFSFSYFLTSINKEPRQTSAPEVSRKNFNKLTTKLKDGSIIYSEAFREMSEKEVLAKVETSLKRNTFGFEGNRNFYIKNQEAFEKLVVYLLNKDISLTFYFSPYHPLAFDFFSADTKYGNFLEAEKYFKNLATEQGIQCVGSFNPHSLGMDASYFLDYQNSNRKCVTKLSTQIEY
jgi:hypothetical protein